MKLSVSAGHDERLRMKEYLIVDGYNIIGAWPELQRLKEMNLEEARDRLIDILADYQGFSGVKVYLVFDAHQVPGLGGKYSQSQVSIYYTREKETADECIEKLVTRLVGRNKQVSVATSDLVEQHVIFGIGALRISARELQTKIRQSKNEIRSQIHSSSRGRNTFDNRLDPATKELFEKWRREK